MKLSQKRKATKQKGGPLKASKATEGTSAPQETRAMQVPTEKNPATLTRTNQTGKKTYAQIASLGPSVRRASPSMTKVTQDGDESSLTESESDAPVSLSFVGPTTRARARLGDSVGAAIPQAQAQPNARAPRAAPARPASAAAPTVPPQAQLAAAATAPASRFPARSLTAGQTSLAHVPQKAQAKSISGTGTAPAEGAAIPQSPPAPPAPAPSLASAQSSTRPAPTPHSATAIGIAVPSKPRPKPIVFSPESVAMRRQLLTEDESFMPLMCRAATKVVGIWSANKRKHRDEQEAEERHKRDRAEALQFKEFKKESRERRAQHARDTLREAALAAKRLQVLQDAAKAARDHMDDPSSDLEIGDGLGSPLLLKPRKLRFEGRGPDALENIGGDSDSEVEESPPPPKLEKGKQIARREPEEENFRPASKVDKGKARKIANIPIPLEEEHNDEDEDDFDDFFSSRSVKDILAAKIRDQAERLGHPIAFKTPPEPRPGVTPPSSAPSPTPHPRVVQSDDSQSDFEESTQLAKARRTHHFHRDISVTEDEDDEDDQDLEGDDVLESNPEPPRKRPRKVSAVSGAPRPQAQVEPTFHTFKTAPTPAPTKGKMAMAKTAPPPAVAKTAGNTSKTAPSAVPKPAIPTSKTAPPPAVPSPVPTSKTAPPPAVRNSAIPTSKTAPSAAVSNPATNTSQTAPPNYKTQNHPPASTVPSKAGRSQKQALVKIQKLGAEINEQIAQLALETGYTPDQVLKRAHITTTKQQQNMYNLHEKVFYRLEAKEGQSAKELRRRADEEYHARTDPNSNTPQEIEEFFDEIQQKFDEIAHNPAFLKDPHVRVRDAHAEMRDEFTRLSRANPDIVFFGVAAYTGSDPLARQVNGIATGSALGQRVLNAHRDAIQPAIDIALDVTRSIAALDRIGAIPPVTNSTHNPDHEANAGSDDDQNDADCPGKGKDRKPPTLRAQVTTALMRQLAHLNSDFANMNTFPWKRILQTCATSELTLVGYPKNVPVFGPSFHAERLTIDQWKKLRNALDMKEMMFVPWSEGQKLIPSNSPKYDAIPLIVGTDDNILATILTHRRSEGASNHPPPAFNVPAVPAIAPQFPNVPVVVPHPATVPAIVPQATTIPALVAQAPQPPANGIASQPPTVNSVPTDPPNVPVPRRRQTREVRYHPYLRGNQPPPPPVNNTFREYRIVAPDGIPRGGRELFQMRDSKDDRWEEPDIQVIEGPAGLPGGRDVHEGRSELRQVQRHSRQQPSRALDTATHRPEVRAYRGEFGRTHRPPRANNPSATMAAGFYTRQVDPPSARRPRPRVLPSEAGVRVAPIGAINLDRVGEHPSRETTPAAYYKQRYARANQAGPSTEVFLDEGEDNEAEE